MGIACFISYVISFVGSADAQHWLTTLGILVQKAEIIIYILPVPLVTTGEVFLGDSKTTRESSFRIQLICSHQYLSNGITIEKVPQSQTIEQVGSWPFSLPNSKSQSLLCFDTKASSC